MTSWRKGPGFSKLLWDFVDGQPKVNRYKTMRQVPAETAISRAMSKELAQRGFKFCGPTIVYAFMQAIGMVNDHLVTCHRHEACAKLGDGGLRPDGLVFQPRPTGPNSLQQGILQGNLPIRRFFRVFGAEFPSNFGPLRQIPYATEQGIFAALAGNFRT